MTLIVATSRADEYALMTSDSMVFATVDEGKWTPDPDRVSGKVKRLTDRVVFASAGCTFIGDECAAMLAERLGEDDDLDTCHRIAQEVVDELWENDRPGEQIELNGRVWSRQSIRDDNRFGFVLNGFRADGTTGLALYRGGERDVDEILSAPRLAQSVIVPPYGVEDDERLEECRALDPTQLEESLGQEGAARRAFSAHRYVGTEYEDRTTKDVNFTLVMREGAEYTTREFCIEWDDLDGFWLLYNGLATLTSPEFAAARRADAAAIREQEGI